MSHFSLDLDTVIHNAGKLFTLPDICLRLRELIDEEESVTEIARLIKTDTALTARLLKIINSALYSFPARIDSIDQAITLLGNEPLYQLALATSAASTFKGAGGRYIDMKLFWQHSIYCALLARLIYKQYVSKDAEILFVIGLLHNIGRLIMLEQVPDVAASALITVNERQFPWQREIEVTGLSCADIGAALLNKWNLPMIIVESIKHQHQPLLAENCSQHAGILHIALCFAGQFTQETSEPNFIATINHKVLQSLSVQTEWVEDQKTEIEIQANELMKIFI
jgi:HD-like signal output (HDOD) protein